MKTVGRGCCVCLPVARWFCSTTCSRPDRCWINEFEVAQIVRSPDKRKKKKKNTLTESRMECALVRGSTNTHSTSPGRFSGAGPVPEGCASFPNVSPDGAESQFVLGLVTACLGTAGWRGALIHIDNHTVMVIVMNHLCHGTRARRSRMD